MKGVLHRLLPCCLLCLLLATSGASADGVIDEQRYYGGGEEDYLYDAVLAPDGKKMLLAGVTNSRDGDVERPEGAEGGCAWAVLTDGTGEIFWQVCVAGEGQDAAFCGVAAYQGAYYAAVRKEDGTSFLVCIDENGAILKNIDILAAVEGVESCEKGLLLFGATPEGVAWASLADNQGNALWTYEGGKASFLAGAEAVGGYLLAGAQDGAGLLTRLDAEGATVSELLMEPEAVAAIEAVAADGDNAIIAGYAPGAEESVETRAVIACVDAEGEILWLNALGEEARNVLSDVIVLPNGYVAGGTYAMPSWNSRAAWVLVIDKQGKVLSDLPVPFGESSEVKRLVRDEDGVVWVAGDAKMMEHDYYSNGLTDQFLAYLQHRSGWLEPVQ